MKSTPRGINGLCILFLPLAATAAEFPPSAVTMTAGQIKAYLDDKVVDARINSGPSRMQFKGDGYVFVNRAGTNFSGKWRTEDGRLCFNFRNSESCNDVRLVDGVMNLKRDNGDLEPYVPK